MDFACYINGAQVPAALVHDLENVLTRDGFRATRIGSRRGYESRKTGGHLEPYSGRYGTGYRWIKPRFDSTQYVWVYYWTK